jgi:hypothetical protein
MIDTILDVFGIYIALDIMVSVLIISVVATILVVDYFNYKEHRNDRTL